MAALILLGLMSPLPALADCTSPAGVEADMYYNTTHKRVQYCDGTNWVNMGVSSAGSSDNLGDHTAAQNVQLGSFWINGDSGNEGLRVDSVGRVQIDQGGDGSTYDIWIQGDASTTAETRNLALLGNEATDTLYLNHGGDYTGGTVIGGVISGNGSGLTTLNATNLASGTVPTARLGTGTANATTYLRGDGQWVAVSGGGDDLGNHIATTVLRSDTHNTDDLGTTAIRWKDGWYAGAVTAGSFTGVGTNLTALNATNLGSGTVPDARFPATLPAVSGVNLTSLNASNLGSGTVPTARLGTGTANATTYLRGDGHWQPVSAGADDLGNHTATTNLNMASYNVSFGSTASDKLYLFSNTYGIGIESGTLTSWAGTNHRWRIGGTSATTGTQEMILAAAGLTVAGNVTAVAYLHSSDERLKKDIETINDPLALLGQLRGVHYKWRADEKPAYGFIAQEVERIIPDAVGTDDKGMKAVEYDQIIAPLVEAVKAQQQQIEALQKDVRALRGAGE